MSLSSNTFSDGFRKKKVRFSEISEGCSLQCYWNVKQVNSEADGKRGGRGLEVIKPQSLFIELLVKDYKTLTRNRDGRHCQGKIYVKNQKI